ncbi:alpha/beta fold hydrolase [Suttonella sp. R2A3]|uniref:alpha/beta hydrolase n=1 Tax=Suttonella sp. R2A3 TaxID=2908648 RepID=UPI001F1E916A|nr:YqiA/YcfP family alpha/beta fold hydrolase [Suttonella sp. R2A3]UJF24518.1 alpha/beta fold hydrolase [Suttonella sp. R2A3]
MHIILSHGRGSSANAKKMVYLARSAEQLGHTTHRVNDSDTQDPDERLKRLIHLVEPLEEPIVLLGSSMGGYTSILAAKHCQQLKGVFLIAPALFVPRYTNQRYPLDLDAPISIVHGWDDEVILYEHSVRYARQTNASLHLIAGDHMLHDAMPTLSTLFTQFLQDIEKD